ncbi:hypothetical protein [Methylorubrum sp. SB2]|uniref:hypothetical protein n=1 Tax=Methylorubrum subtropicum TaxID=3138812 RepID=UPI00313CEABD
MRTKAVAGIGAGLTAAALAVFLASIDREHVPPPRPAPEASRPAASAEPRLYCEFYNFASRTPKVGFYFTAPTGGGEYAQIFQKEADGEQSIFDPRPAWTHVRDGDPPTLNSPDGAITINLYGDAKGATRPASVASGGWFEAGLRSTRYLNLEGQCRRTAT